MTTPKHDRDLTGLAALAGEWVDAALASQEAGLKILKAEMEVLAAVLPGAAGEAGKSAAETEADLRAEAEKLEQDLDNLPV